MANPEHLRKLEEGIDTWNEWREKNADVRPELDMAELSGRDLSKFNLQNANLISANLQGCVLIGSDLSNTSLNGANLKQVIAAKADFQGANLAHATLSNAIVIGANFRSAKFNTTRFDSAHAARADFLGADLYNTLLRDTDLSYADLRQARLERTRLQGANLTECYIYGISVWDVETDENTVQENLVLEYRNEPIYEGRFNVAPFRDTPLFTVDNLEVAQFLYLLLKNEKIRDVIDTIGHKRVLILGRFTPDRKKVLNGLREALRAHGYLPILFDFERARTSDFTESIKVLAGLSCFVIADITNAKSSPLELQAIIPDYMVPFVPIIEMGEKPFSMFEDLQNKYGWVMRLLEYQSIEQLVEKIDRAIIRPALELHAELQLKRARKIQSRSLHDY